MLLLFTSDFSIGLYFTILKCILYKGFMREVLLMRGVDFQLYRQYVSWLCTMVKPRSVTWLTWRKIQIVQGKQFNLTFFDHILHDHYEADGLLMDKSWALTYLKECNTVFYLPNYLEPWKIHSSFQSWYIILKLKIFYSIMKV